MHETKRAGHHRSDRKNQSDGERRLDHAGRVHPTRRRPEFCGDKETERLGDEEFRVNMRDEKQSADQAQYVDAVGEIEILQISGHSPPRPPRIFLLISLSAAQLPSPPRGSSLAQASSPLK